MQLIPRDQKYSFEKSNFTTGKASDRRKGEKVGGRERESTERRVQIGPECRDGDWGGMQKIWCDMQQSKCKQKSTAVLVECFMAPSGNVPYVTSTILTESWIMLP